ncbi:MAG: ABC-F family ATP-binding cassette domain-containing protein [Zhaonellaceae bacterium]|jgi:ATP-binding cassette subfamily F protein 3|nr:ABC-F family ATP-binding cassette domain-containing protein [Clostridia bacterium]
MSILAVQGLTKYFGEKVIFTNVQFQLEAGEKVALVGANGTGKTTLLRCLAGWEEFDEGQIFLAKDVRIGFLTQTMEVEDLDLTLSEFMLEEYRDLIDLRKELKQLEKKMSLPEIYNSEAELNKIMKMYAACTEKYEAGNGYLLEKRIKEVILGLGFSLDDSDRPMNTFSGGQKTRLYLARILLREPELLFLDEPTNYLDLKSIEWLEGFLQAYKGTILIVSHDRYFLDKITEQVLELEDTQVISYNGNYSAFMLQKAMKEASQAKEYAKEQAKIKRLEEYIRKNKAGVNARQARGREKQLAKMGHKSKPKERKSLSFSFQKAYESGEEVLKVKKLNLFYPGKTIAENLTFTVQRGDRIGLVGPNGCGKTTLLKALLGKIPYEGSIAFGVGVKVGYYAQEHEDLSFTGTVIDEVMSDNRLTIQMARDLLARFQFKGEDVYKNTQELSGGEKSRLVLAKLFLAEANFLILDEPTNHLDIYARQGLEDALAEFSGTIMLVSHDRYLLNKLATKVFEFSEGGIKIYEGDYDFYRYQKAKEEEAIQIRKTRTKNEKVHSTKQEKTGLNLKTLEAEIIAAEEELAKLAEKLGDPEIYAVPQEVVALQKKYRLLELSLTELYEEWERAAEETGQEV